jgi:hypothetical protein
MMDALPWQPFGDDPLDEVTALSDIAVAEDSAALSEPADASDGFWTGLFDFGSSDASSETPMDDATDIKDEATAQSSSFSRLTGLFGFGGQQDNPDSADAAPREVKALAFGEMTTRCGMRASDLGVKVAESGGFALYDSAPSGTGLRPHYVTGFSDGCPQATLAALILTGDVGTHELVRYSSANRRQAYSETDTAYEGIKSKFCGVTRNKPCGRKLDALARNTLFLSVYERFGGNDTWVEVLLHNGRFVAIDEEDM